MLTDLGAGIWEANQPLSVLGFEVGHRMTVARLGSGELLVHSPVMFSTAVRNDLRALGPVTFVAAPNGMHDLYLRDWIEAYPEATLLHSPALKLKGIDPDRARALTRESIGELRVIPVEGMPKLQEFVFLYEPAGRLIVADLVFNLAPGRGLQKVLQKMNGIHERLAPSKFFRSFIRDNEAFRTSVEEILGLPFEALSVSHGSNVDAHARERLARAFEWLRIA